VSGEVHDAEAGDFVAVHKGGADVYGSAVIEWLEDVTVQHSGS